MRHSPPDRPSTNLPNATRLLGVDWGTTRLRVHAIGEDGECLATRTSDDGLMTVTSRASGGESASDAYAAALRAAADDWLQADLPVMASGMVTSRQGWREVAYVSCPGDAAAIAAGLDRVSLDARGNVHLVPGMICTRTDGLPDVMRGEETQILGACDTGHSTPVVLPGTHCKWASLSNGRIESFTTVMTGELFSLLSEHSILALMLDGDASHAPAAFTDGVKQAREASGRVLPLLFAGRTLPLTGALTDQETGSWLSGLLIGAEIATLLSTATRPPEEVTIVGQQQLGVRYRTAFGLFEVDARLIEADTAAATGQWRIARAARLV